jgi:hypothetical protein
MMLTRVMTFVSRFAAELGERFKKRSISSRVWHKDCLIASTW